MTKLHDAWLARQRARWMRPNAHLYMRPDADRFMRPDAQRWLRPDWKRYVQPGFEPFILSLLEGKANFSPNQPRVPKGNPDGGQWTDEDGEDGFAESDDDALTDISDARRRPPGIGPNEGPPLDEPPRIPEKKPATIQEQNASSKAAAQWLEKVKQAKGPLPSFFLMIEEIKWFDEHQKASILSYQDPPKTLDELREAATGASQRGYEDHHIRGQTAAKNDGFPDSLIHSSENIVRIPYWKHREITGWFNTKNEEPRFGGRAPAEYLRGKSWEERLDVGLEALRLHKVLK